MGGRPVTPEEFAAEVSRAPPNIYEVDRGSHFDGYVLACRDLGLDLRRPDSKEISFYRGGRRLGRLVGTS